MEIFDVKRFPNKGGSLRVFAQKKSNNFNISKSVQEFINFEIKEGLYEEKTYKNFVNDIENLKSTNNNYLLNQLKQGKKIAGYGASATVTTLLHYFDLGNIIDFIVDDNEVRHNTFSPGHHIPVYNTDQIYKSMPDIIVILAWRFANDIIAKHQKFIDKGGQFIVPLPEFKIIKN